ncbi:GntR family transcriptional regulator [Jiangella aurantiaca]|uniref:GntR family transcriptional regulator n=1 Tax=Jiangella aurantiaca TaxID=2530373 RepID=A0A4V2YSF1_9ACTN|nr:GntR family transcriptional regulator [Jiangella aurantiaca]TDD69057.1 GntR family transcriptional regulator [Jiangella aurantiaca]
MAWEFSAPVPSAPALGQHVVERLRVLIVTGRIPRGAHLVEAQLSSMFDVSRGPIRDALRQLEAEGLVESRRRGVFVVGLEAADIAELYSLRESLETLALRMAHENAQTATWQALLEPLDRMRSAADAGRADEYARADLDFHARFYDLSGHRRLRDIWRQYQPTFAVLLEITNAEDVTLGPSLQSHVDLYELMRAGRLDEAVVELKEHLLGARNRLMTAHARVTAANSADSTAAHQDGRA